MEQVTISLIQAKDCEAVKSISDACFGINYLKMEQISELLSKEGIYYKLEFKNNVIGFCLTTITYANAHYLGFEVEEKIKNKIAVIKTIAINPQYQRKGYGTRLLQLLVSKIQNNSEIKAIYYPSWVESESDGFTKMVEDEGFKQYKRYKNFWLDESISSNYKCLNCGNPPCYCTMLLYRKALIINLL